MSKKLRITVTVDPAVHAAATRAVAEGRADSVSDWVNKSLAKEIDHEHGLQMMAEAVADYEAEFGKITDEEMAEQQRLDLENAIVVDGRRKGKQERDAA